MNRTDLQRLADERVADAEALLVAGRWPAAYYLLGYAVECAIKSCAAREFGEHEVPDRKFVNDFYTHDLERLLRIARAMPALEARRASEPSFEFNWRLLRDWNEASRYNVTTSESKARDIFNAVTDAQFGVLPWLKTLW